MVTSCTLQFPKEDNIRAYLETYCAVEKKIIDKIAYLFANQTHTRTSVSFWLFIALDKDNLKCGLSKKTLVSIRQELMKALIDCAAATSRCQHCENIAAFRKMKISLYDSDSE